MRNYIEFLIIKCYTKTGIDNCYFLLIFKVLGYTLLTHLDCIRKEDTLIDVFFSYAFINPFE